MKQITDIELFRRFGEVSLERDQLKDDNYLLNKKIEELSIEIGQLRTQLEGLNGSSSLDTES